MSFIESPRFPDDISYGSSGGPAYSTDVVTVKSGYEKRNSNWVQSRHSYDAAFGIATESQLSNLLSYFHSMYGKTHTFRYKDWGDFKSCDMDQEPSFLDQVIGYGDSSDGYFDTTYNGSITSIGLQRTNFTDSSRTEPTGYFDGLELKFSITANGNNNISVPILSYDSVNQAFVIDPTDLIGDLSVGDTYTIYKEHTSQFQLIKSYTNGLVTVRDINKPVGTDSSDSTVVIAVNGVVQVEDTEYTLDYTTGLVSFNEPNVPLIGAVITAGYEFDVPCRFDTDMMNVNYDSYAAGSVSVPIIEVRV